MPKRLVEQPLFSEQEAPTFSLPDSLPHDMRYNTMVQGELFADHNEAERPERGYRGTVASNVAGITYRQLDYWARKQIVVPSITPSHGSGSRRLYSFKDIVILAVSKKLLDVGVNLANVTSAIEFLMQRSCQQLEHTTILCDGDTVHECIGGEQMESLLHDGRAVFGISVGSLWHRVEERLEDEEYVEVGVQDRAARINRIRPIDELAAMRMRKQFEERRQQRQLSL